MGQTLAILAGGAGGALAGYALGVYLACFVLWPESNLCGLVGVFVTAPIGSIAGCVAGWALMRKRGKP